MIQFCEETKSSELWHLDRCCVQAQVSSWYLWLFSDLHLTVLVLLLIHSNYTLVFWWLSMSPDMYLLMSREASFCRDDNNKDVFIFSTDVFVFPTINLPGFRDLLPVCSWIPTKCFSLFKRFHDQLCQKQHWTPEAPRQNRAHFFLPLKDHFSNIIPESWLKLFKYTIILQRF